MKKYLLIILILFVSCEDKERSNPIDSINNDLDGELHNNNTFEIYNVFIKTHKTSISSYKKNFLNWNQTKLFGKDVSFIINGEIIDPELKYLELNNLINNKLGTEPQTYLWEIPKITMEFFPNYDFDLSISFDFFHYKDSIANVILYQNNGSELDLNNYISTGYGEISNGVYNIKFNNVIQFKGFNQLKLLFSNNSESVLLSFNNQFSQAGIKNIKRFIFPRNFLFKYIIESTENSFFYYENNVLTKFNSDTLWQNIHLDSINIWNGIVLKPKNDLFFYFMVGNEILEIDKNNLNITNRFQIPNGFYAFDYIYGPVNNNFYYFKEFPSTRTTEIASSNTSFQYFRSFSFHGESLQYSSIYIDENNILYGWERFLRPPSLYKIDITNESILFNQSHFPNIDNFGQKFLYLIEDKLFWLFNGILTMDINNFVSPTQIDFSYPPDYNTEFRNSKVFIIKEEKILTMWGYYDNQPLLPIINCYNKESIALEDSKKIIFNPYADHWLIDQVYSIYPISINILLFGNGLYVKVD